MSRAQGVLPKQFSLLKASTNIPKIGFFQLGGGFFNIKNLIKSRNSSESP